MKKFYILSTKKSWIKEWLSNGTWSFENMTSVIVEKHNGKKIQIFGSGKIEDYGHIGQEVDLYSYWSWRLTGCGVIVGYNNEGIEKGATTYVFK